MDFQLEMGLHRAARAFDSSKFEIKRLLGIRLMSHSLLANDTNLTSQCSIFHHQYNSMIRTNHQKWYLELLRSLPSLCTVR